MAVIPELFAAGGYDEASGISWDSPLDDGGDGASVDKMNVAELPDQDAGEPPHADR